MTRRRVVITGIGAITPVGSGADGLWDGVMANRSAVRTIDRFDATPFPSRIAAQVDDFHPADHLDVRRARRLDRFSAMSVAASRMAFEDAGLAGAATRPNGGSGSARRSEASRSARSSTPASSRGACVAWRRHWRLPSRRRRSEQRASTRLTGPTVGNANRAPPARGRSGQAAGAIRDGTVDVAWPAATEAPWRPYLRRVRPHPVCRSQRGPRRPPRALRSRSRRLSDG